MLLTHSVRYDAPLADVYAMLTDPVFREKAATSQGLTSVDVAVDGGDVRLHMEQPTTDLPGFARKVVGETSKVVQAGVRIPLIGGKLETLIGSKLKDGWNNEHAIGTAWLAGDR